jgi:hypothetical protein
MTTDFPVNEEWATLRRVERLVRQQEALEREIEAERLDLEAEQREKLLRDRRERIWVTFTALSTAMTWTTVGLVVGAGIAVLMK